MLIFFKNTHNLSETFAAQTNNKWMIVNQEKLELELSEEPIQKPPNQNLNDSEPNRNLFVFD